MTAASALGRRASRRADPRAEARKRARLRPVGDFFRAGSACFSHFRLFGDLARPLHLPSAPAVPQLFGDDIMIRRRKNRSTPCCLLAALVCLAAAHAAEAQTLSLIYDDFEDSDAPQDPPWTELGSTGIETANPIGDAQSLVFSSSLGGGAEEPDLICTNFTSSVVFMRAEFWVDLQYLDIPEGASFELISLYEGNGPMAVAVRLGQSNGEQWVSLEAGENGENFVGTQQHLLALPPRGQVLRHIKLVWDQGDAANGSASLEIADAFSTLTLELVGLENSQLGPDDVRLGIGAPKPQLTDSMGSFLLDDVVLRITQ